MKSIEINDLSDRAAMGLSANEVVGTVIPMCVANIGFDKMDLQLLSKVAEDPAAELPRRLFAGSVLGFLRDPRISTKTPEMIKIPGAKVQIGLSADRVEGVVSNNPNLSLHKGWILKESPMHQVSISEFSIGKYLVTNLEYAKFIEETSWTELPTSWEFGILPPTKQNHPVYSVSPESADAYCNWLSHKTGRKFRLPTEYEWEYAASGPEGLEYPWGNEWIEGLCNTVELKHYNSTPVGIFPKSNSPFGVTDMAGNVEEYTSSIYSVYPGGSVVEDDLYRIDASYRIARGGSFTRHRDLARCRRRHGRYPKEIYVMGFRLAESV